MSQKHWYLNSETTLDATLKHDIAPFWARHVCQGRFVGEGNIHLCYAYCVPDNATSSVLISSGRIESLLKYQEVIYELYRNGCAVFILDHRGQGLSGRMTTNRHHGYVDNFNQYVADMGQFIDNVVTPRQCGELNLLCHSMGAAIGALMVLARPTQFSRAVFCSPMFGIRPAMPEWLAKTLIAANSLCNRIIPGSSGYFFGQRDYHADEFDTNRLTSSEIRYQRFRTLYNEQPELQLGGVTPQWLAAASTAMWDVETHASEIAIPVLVFSAADDTVVDNQRQARVIAKMPEAEYVSVAGARHELLIESDAIRQPVMLRIFDFISSDL